MVPFRFVEAQVLFQPHRGAPQSLLQRDQSLPPEKRLGLRWIGEEDHYLAVVWAQALLLHDHVCLRTERSADGIEELTDGDHSPGAKLDYLTLNALNLRSLDEALNCVCHEGQVAFGVQAAELYLLSPRKELDQDGREDSPGRLPRTVGVEGP